MIIGKIKSNRGFIAICECDYCGGEYRRSFFSASKSKRTFCSHGCKGKYFSGKNNCNFKRTFSKETLKKMSDAKKGIYEGKNHPMYGVHRYGKENPMWKGGVVDDGQGYVYIYNRSHPYPNNRTYVYEHRLVMEKAIGRYLKSEEQVHHINGIRHDNRLGNLMLFKNASEHKKHHHMLKKVKVLNGT